jgi:hypothetical protein
VANNLHNILATLLRLGEEEDARSLLEQVRTSYPPPVVTQLDQFIQGRSRPRLLRQEHTP